MLIIGLTGGIGSGKTTVSNLFSNYGIPIIDTDVIAKELTNNNPIIIKNIIDIFGKEIIKKDGTLDRKELSNIVFNQHSKKVLLEKLLHPQILIEVEKQINAYSSLNPSPHYIVVVVPLLIETTFLNIIDQVLVVISDIDERIKRIQHRDQRKTEEIKKIVNSQVNDKDRISIATNILENNSTVTELERTVFQLHSEYLLQ